MLDDYGIVVNDYDDCIDEDRNIEPEIRELIDIGNTLTIFSPSGRGLHQICEGKKPSTACISEGFEQYERGHFMTFTGKRVPGTPFEINEAPEVIQAVNDRIVAAQKNKGSKVNESIETEEFETDEELIEYAKRNNKAFKKLYDGTVTGKKYKSPSEAEQALFRLTSIYTKNIDRIERIVRMSKLYRPKWDTHPTYLRDSIEEVLSTPAMPAKTEKSKEEVKIREPYIITDNRIYLSVIDKRGNLEFAWLEGNQVQFAESVEIDEETIYPQSLPVDNVRKSKFIISIPEKEELEQAVVLSADDLFKLIIEHMKTYLDALDSDIELFVYFALFTWYYKKGSTVPYLRFIGDLGTGKSRFMSVVGDLCFYTVTATGSSSIAGLIRINEDWHGTMRVDAADLEGDESNKTITFFNTGFQDDKPFIKANTNQNNSRKVDIYDPFCPKLIAMRKPFRDMATESRCLSYSMQPMSRKGEEKIDINLAQKYRQEANKLRALIARFVMKNWHLVTEDNCIQYKHLDLEPRLKQLAYPLSIILQLFLTVSLSLKNTSLEGKKK